MGNYLVTLKITTSFNVEANSPEQAEMNAAEGITIALEECLDLYNPDVVIVKTEEND